jgi:uncharacterized protein (DUF433 family)
LVHAHATLLFPVFGACIWARIRFDLYYRVVSEPERIEVLTCGIRAERLALRSWDEFVVNGRLVVRTDPEVMSGTIVFMGTRGPFQTLFDYLQADQPLAEFLEDFPTVSKEQAIAALEQAKEALLDRARPAR